MSDCLAYIVYLDEIALGNVARPFLNDPTVWPFGLGKRLWMYSIKF